MFSFCYVMYVDNFFTAFRKLSKKVESDIVISADDNDGETICRVAKHNTQNEHDRIGEEYYFWQDRRIKTWKGEFLKRRMYDI